MTMPTIANLRAKLKRKSPVDLAVEKLKKFQKPNSDEYDVWGAYDSGEYEREFLAQVFGEDVITSVEKLSGEYNTDMAALEPYRKEDNYDVRGALNAGVPADILKRRFGEDAMTALAAPVPANADILKPVSIENIPLALPVQETVEERDNRLYEQAVFETQVLPTLPGEIMGQYFRAKRGDITADEFNEIYRTWQETRKLELTELVGKILPGFAEIAEDKRTGAAMAYLDALYKDEAVQAGFVEAIRAMGHTPEAEDIIKGVMPGFTARDIKIIFGENVTPLEQLPLAGYRISEQPLQDVMDYALKDPEGLRRAVRYEGRTPETEALLESVYGVLPDNYLDKYFETGPADDFLTGKWLPKPLKDYWGMAVQGIGDILSMTGGVADRFGADGMAEELKLAGTYGQVYAKDVKIADKYTPQWFAQNMARMAPMMLGLMGVSIITGGTASGVIAAAGGGTFLQAAGAAVVSGVVSSAGEGLMEAGDAYNEAKARGLNDKEAGAVFDRVFQQNFALLSGSNTIQYGLTFFIPGGKATSFLVKALTYGFDAASEGAEEAGQLAIQRGALGEPQRFDDEMLQSLVLGTAGGFGFAGIGTVNSLIQEKIINKMPESDYDQFRQKIQSYIGLGFSRKEAEAKAWDEFSGTPEGLTAVKEAADEVMAEEAAEMRAQAPQAQAAVKEISAQAGTANEQVDNFVNEFTQPAEEAPQAVAEFNETDAGIQKSMLEEVPEAEVRVQGKGKTTQITMDDQMKLEQSRRGIPNNADEAQAELETINEQIKSDPVANYKINIGNKKTGKGEKAKIIKDMRTLEWFISLREGEIPETFTVKQARALNPRKSYSKYLQQGAKNYNKVPRDEVFDEIASELGFEDSEALSEHINKLREMRRRADYLKKWLEAEPETQTEETAEEKADNEAVTSWNELDKSIEEWRIKRETVKAMKQLLIDFTRANIPAVAERGKFLESVAKAETEYDVQAVMEKVKQYAAERARAVLQKKIRKAMEKTKPKYQGGMKKGRFIAEVQSQLDAIRKNIDGDRQAAINQIANNIQDSEDGKLDYGDMLIGNELLATAGINEQSVEQLQRTLEYIKSLKDYGRAVHGEDIAKFRAKMESWKKDIVNDLTGGKGLKAGSEAMAKEAELPPAGIIEKLINRQYGWQDLLDKASKLSGGKPFQSFLSKFGAQVMRARDAENGRMQRIAGQAQAKAREIFGVKNNGQLNDILNRQSNKKIDLGKFAITDEDGRHVITLEMTKAQMIKKYQEFKDPSLTDTFDRGMHWTAEIQNAITSGLTAQERAWADWQMEFYQQYYNDVNAVYREVYGIDLPHNLNYSPISRDFDSDVPEQQLVYRDLARWAVVTNGSLKTRQRNIQPLKLTDANRTLINHITQMEHFINWAKPMRELRTVFSDKSVRNAFYQYHGRDILNQIDSYIQDFSRGGVNKMLNVSLFDKARGNFAKAILGFKPAIALQQIPTVFAYLTEMKTGDFLTGVISFWSDPVNSWKWMMKNVPYLKERYEGGFERDMKVAMSGDAYKSFLGKQNFTNVLYFLMSTGDKFAVLQGWWAKYRAEYNRLMAEGRDAYVGEKGVQQEAIEEANNATDRTQNTSSIDTLSAWQRGGTFWKLLTMFQSQPNKYFRIIANNLRNFQYKRGSRVKALSNVALAWVILPAIFTLIQNGFRWRKDRELADVAMAPVNDLLFFGQISQTVNDWIVGETFDYQPTPVMAPVRDALSFIQKAGKIIDQAQDPYDDITADEWIKFIESLLKPVGEITGVPTPYLIMVEKAIRSGDPRQLVFSQWALEEGKPDLATKANTETVKLGLQKETGPTAIVPADKAPEIYQMTDLYTYYNQTFSKTLPSDITEKKGFNAVAAAWGQAAVFNDAMESLPGKKLYEIIEDLEKDNSLEWTFAQYYQQWQARQKIKSLAELKDFDKENPRAFLGNITSDQYKLLLQYEGLDKAGRETFLKEHPELNINPRIEWLKAHPQENAALALWGKANIYTQEAYNAAVKLQNELGIADAALPDRVFPPKEIAGDYFKYQDSVNATSANSWETQLIIVQNDKLRGWLGREDISTPAEALELQIKHRELYDIEASYRDKDSANYIADDDLRAAAIKALKTANTEWVDDMRRVEAIKNNGSQYQNDWAERGKTVDRYGAGSSEAKLWLLEHGEVFRWALGNKLLTDDGAGWNKKVLEIDVEYRGLDKQYESYGDEESNAYIDDEKARAEARKALLVSNPEYADAQARRAVYAAGGDDAAAENNVEYATIVRQYSGGSAEARLYRIDHPDFDLWGRNTETFGWSEIKDNVNILRINAQWRIFDEQYEAIKDADPAVQAGLREEYLNERLAYKAERRRREAYQLFGSGQVIPVGDELEAARQQFYNAYGISPETSERLNTVELYPTKEKVGGMYEGEKIGIGAAYPENEAAGTTSYLTERIAHEFGHRLWDDLTEEAKAAFTDMLNKRPELGKWVDTHYGAGAPVTEAYATVFAQAPTAVKDGVMTAEDYKAFYPGVMTERLLGQELRGIPAQGAYQVPEEMVEKYVAYMDLPLKGKRRDRFLIENPEFARMMHKAAGIDLPDTAPSVQYDDIYDQYAGQFEKLEGLADNKSPYYIEDPEEREKARDAMRFKDGKLTEFGLAEIKRQAYANYIPDEYIERYAGYYKVLAEGRPENWPKDRNGNKLTWYEDDWYLQEHPEFYENVYLGVLELEPVDFSMLPSREVFQKYAIYSGLPEGKRRDDYRAANRDLDKWLVAAGIVTTPIGEKTRRTHLTPAEQKAEEVAKLRERLKH